MAVITLNNDLVDSDRRFRRWGKTILGPGDIDLAQRNGYSLTGAFVPWDSSVALEPGQYLAVAVEQGSIKNHEYVYALFTVDGDGEVVQITTEQIREAVNTLPDAVRAQALNSRLYRYAAYAAAMFGEGAGVPAHAAGRGREQTIRIERAIKAMQVLDASERAAVLSALTERES